MSRRNNRVVTYLSDEEEAQLNEWADESGKSHSALLREAVLEYLDHDRAARVEEIARENQDLLEELHTLVADDGTHTHKDQGGMRRGSDSLETARQMVRRLQSNHDEVIKVDDVDRVIEDMAGVDERTIRKYKDIFRRRGLLYEHPGQPPVWTTDGNIWLEWLESYAQLNGPDEAEQVAEQYPTRVTRDTTGDDGVNIELIDEVTQ
jgi:hypothetical protein